MKWIWQKIKRMPEEHPDFPLYLSIVALIASFIMPVVNRTLGLIP